ncbi:MAG: class I SAM-dependent methyltransferase [Kutzneria sp.]|nr:class I SAM-dependent methyltransferase [Kutzneria sp.]MBV9846818.1 class I SAM-dependent methyltransferase [Kutzneria sp.]
MERSQQHYFTPAPDVAVTEHTITVELPDLELTLTTSSGVFSPKRLDPGTRVLLENAPPPPVDGDVLDLGCGYGPIALALAHRYPGRRVVAVDVNTRALDLARRNAVAAGLSAVDARPPEDVPADARFAAIYSNPPIRTGKQALHEMLLIWLARLLPAGRAYLVVQRNLGSDSLAGWLDQQGHPVRRICSRRGYRVLEVAGQ